MRKKKITIVKGSLDNLTELFSLATDFALENKGIRITTDSIPSIVKAMHEFYLLKKQNKVIAMSHLEPFRSK